MKTQHIRLLIILMAIALSGLIFLQYKWIKEAIAVKEARFDQKVNDALHTVAHKLEKLETLKFMGRSVTTGNPNNGNVVVAKTLEYENIQPVIVDGKIEYYVDSKEFMTCTETFPSAKQHIEKGHETAFLGVFIDNAPEHLSPGALVKDIVEDSPAAKAGLRKGDVITGIGNKAVATPEDLKFILKNYQAGEDVRISYQRPQTIAEAPIFKQMANLYGDFTEQKLINDYMNTDSLSQSKNLPMPLDQTTMATLSESMAKSLQHLQSLAFEMTLMNKPLKERVDPKILASTIDQTLKDVGVNIPYHYCLQAGNKCLVDDCTIYSNYTDTAPAELYYTSYRKQLGDDALLAQSGELLLYFPDRQKYIWSSSALMLGSSLLFNLIIILIFTYTMQTIIRQKKLSDMKTDFINNMTHELKTPISTIKLACEILRDTSLPITTPRLNKYANIIDQENTRLQSHVEKVLHYARLERGDLKLKMERLDMRDLITDAINKVALQIENKQGTIELIEEAEQTSIKGDALHLVNVISNLLDNAIKYAKPDTPPIIQITTKNENDFCVISIKDNGIGMNKDTLKKIFEKFYRIPTGNIHNVKGFGLGLSYVKLIIDAHHGNIQAKSRVNKGSTFDVFIPLN